MSYIRGRSLRLPALVIVLAVVACGRSPTAGDDGDDGFDFSRDLIAFESTRDGSLDIHLMTVDGKDVINITKHSAPDGDPAWSPDGSRIAFASMRHANTAEIYVMNVDGSNVTRLTNNSAVDRYPAWSPDGSTIAFSSNRDGNFEIYLMDADGSNQRRLTTNVSNDSEPVWVADGSKIVFCSTRLQNADIWIMNADGTGLLNLTNDPSSFDCAPSTLPGSLGRIAFVSDRAAGNLSIYTMDIDGSNVWRVTVDANDDFDSSWSRDGVTLVFDSDRSGNWDIYSISEDGTNLQRLTTHVADDWNPVWRP
jgi:Tol biopolymer transport system component